MAKDLTEQFPGLKEASADFNDFHVVDFRPDPDAGFPGVYLLQLLFEDGDYGLAIYNVITKAFIEEPGEYEYFDEEEDAIALKYNFDHNYKYQD